MLLVPNNYSNLLKNFIYFFVSLTLAHTFSVSSLSSLISPLLYLSIFLCLKNLSLLYSLFPPEASLLSSIAFWYCGIWDSGMGWISSSLAIISERVGLDGFLSSRGGSDIKYSRPAVSVELNLVKLDRNEWWPFIVVVVVEVGVKSIARLPENNWILKLDEDSGSRFGFKIQWGGGDGGGGVGGGGGFEFEAGQHQGLFLSGEAMVYLARQSSSELGNGYLAVAMAGLWCDVVGMGGWAVGIWLILVQRRERDREKERIKNIKEWILKWSVKINK